MNEKEANALAAQKLNELSVTQLIKYFEVLDVSPDPNVPTVRGWILEELNRRNPVAFEAFVDSCDDSPRAYYLKGE